jgi:hypothetical protein
MRSRASLASVSVKLADEFAAVLVAEVQGDISCVEFEHVPGVPAEGVPRGRAEIDVAEGQECSERGSSAASSKMGGSACRAVS